MTAFDADDQALVDAARSARERAYVPYSKFAMGAAVRYDDGGILPGALVENVSLGLAMCAERVALFSGVASGAGTPIALALVAGTTDGELTFPCGACLQVALELGGPEVVVIASSADGAVSGRSTIGELLPRGPKKR
jgi:homotetrameric cytidine deaminase